MYCCTECSKSCSGYSVYSLLPSLFCYSPQRIRPAMTCRTRSSGRRVRRDAPGRFWPSLTCGVTYCRPLSRYSAIIRVGGWSFEEMWEYESQRSESSAVTNHNSPYEKSTGVPRRLQRWKDSVTRTSGACCAVFTNFSLKLFWPVLPVNV